MIDSKKKLEFYLAADLMMNRGILKRSLLQTIKEFFFPDYIMEYLRTLRKCSYYKHCYRITPPQFYYNKLKLRRLSIKLGFSIGFDTFGYGLVIPHYGTIVVGNSNRIGNYAVIHTCTCISDNGKIIGDGLYLATGAIITSKVILGNNVSVGANSVVNKSFEQGNALIAGMPAKYIRDAEAWYIRDGSLFLHRIQIIERFKQQLGLVNE